ncbi:preprotein translocase subunit SecG [Brevundimonas diminuta]|jgi:preprotein translocase subunit SecG|uniref:Protein-export membrane protein SecG n=2 Tax=Caulobacteraceae TaxID=76892 RepID=A0A172Y4G0_9CAUL|nr:MULTISPECIES: preprotein translocase subunit SecG [Brevundimonas]HAC01189.1 preprotein translocase subunit SecG [Brevundimonas sp.]ANF53985.1 preprotein translocase subunit SecG [Brevundimonas naejangsanensis]MCO8019035.1 preprotein translocase subunit SecG [Brevundimonas diminuta]MCO8021712.1 preprotein translocase subunit SecG [Brevundimonas diminuta]MCO8030230.1 preprotein translocase subunit SecG [Brevundimonas diminuta]
MNDAMLQTILLVAMIIISVSLSAVILLQRSEGGALGMGGGPSGFMTARGAGNLLTRVTSILAVAFFVCAIGLTIAGNYARGSRSVIDADAVGSIALDQPEQTAPAPEAAPATPAAPAAPSLDDLEASLPAGQGAPAQ